MVEISWEDSIFSDVSKNFVSNPNPDLGEEVEILFRVLKGAPIASVILCYVHNGDEKIIVTNYSRGKSFDYYKCNLKMNQKRIHYYFRIHLNNEEVYYYNKIGLSMDPILKEYDFKVRTDKSIDWVKSSVFYQIFPDRFYSGNDISKKEDRGYMIDGYKPKNKKWYQNPGRFEEDFCLDFFGGDLEGIKEKIPYLKKLGVNALYLNPIFYAISNHRYDCIDYFKVDPYLGDEDSLKSLVGALHKEGIRIILDISINHTGVEHKWLNKNGVFFDKEIGGYNNDVKERDYYFFDENNNSHFWLGDTRFTTLNYTSQALRDVMYKGQDSVLKKWLSEPFKIDGWRFDAANALGRLDDIQIHHQLWRDIREEIKSVNKEAYMVGESWLDCCDFLEGNKWDASINYYGFCQPLRRFLNMASWFQCNPSDAVGFATTTTQYLAKIPDQIAHQQFNFLDSHDIDRAHNNEVSYETYRGGVIILFTFPGVPNIYYGSEIGLRGHVENVEGSRYPMEWDENKHDKRIYNLYKRLIDLRREEVALQEGSFKVLYAQGNILSYTRFAGDKVYIVVSSQEREDRIIEIPIYILGVTGQASIRELFGRDESCRMKRGIVKLDDTSYKNVEGVMEINIKGEETLLFEIIIDENI